MNKKRKTSKEICLHSKQHGNDILKIIFEIKKYKKGIRKSKEISDYYCVMVDLLFLP